jgi:hypothetical protein
MCTEFRSESCCLNIHVPTTRCRIEWYCSIECHRSDWPRHHVNCVPSSTNAPHGSVLATTQTVKALVLFANLPELHWRTIKVHTYILSTGRSQAFPQFDPVLNLGGELGSRICLQDVGGSFLSFPYQIFFRNGFLCDGSPINIGIRSLHPDIGHPWAGNIVILKFNGSRRQGYRDMELGDIPTIAQFFRTYSEN